MNRDSKTIPSWSLKSLNSPVDGISIRYAIREVENPQLRILFLNGRNEWIEKYEDLPGDTQFGENATWVTMDHRGQGASGGAKAHVQSYDDFARDTAAVVAATFGDLPYIIIAHSMGGLIAMYSTLKQMLKPKALILSSPLFGMLTPMPLHIARYLSHLLALTPIGKFATGAGSDRRARFEGNPLTHSQTRFNKLNDTIYKAVTPSFAWVNATFKATATVFDEKLLKNLKIPVTILVGSEELVVDFSVFDGWFATWKKATGRQAIFKVIPGASHELFNEEEQYRAQAITLLNESIRI